MANLLLDDGAIESDLGEIARELAPLGIQLRHYDPGTLLLFPNLLEQDVLTESEKRYCVELHNSVLEFIQCIILLNPQEEILHLEFQVAPVSVPAMPIRMLDYYARLRRQYSFYPIQQVVIYLKETTSNAVFIEQFTDTNTVHRFRSIRIWEQEPATLLASVGLLPLAVLARTDSPESLLSQVAAQVDMIEEPSQQRNISACTQLLAGLKYDNNLIRSLLREELMKESVVYQRIIRQGIEQGIEQGKREEALSVVMRLLPRRIGIVAPELRRRSPHFDLAQ